MKYGNGDKGKVLKDAQFVLLNKNKDKVAVVDNGSLPVGKTFLLRARTEPSHGTLAPS